MLKLGWFIGLFDIAVIGLLFKIEFIFRLLLLNLLAVLCVLVWYKKFKFVFWFILVVCIWILLVLNLLVYELNFNWLVLYLFIFLVFLIKSDLGLIDDINKLGLILIFWNILDLGFDFFDFLELLFELLFLFINVINFLFWIILFKLFLILFSKIEYLVL